MMALIGCAECGNEVSDKAASCPKCGKPVVTPIIPVPTPTPPVSGTQATEGTEGCPKCGLTYAVKEGKCGHCGWKAGDVLILPVPRGAVKAVAVLGFIISGFVLLVVGISDAFGPFEGKPEHWLDRISRLFMYGSSLWLLVGCVGLMDRSHLGRGNVMASCAGFMIVPMLSVLALMLGLHTLGQFVSVLVVALPYPIFALKVLWKLRPI